MKHLRLLSLLAFFAFNASAQNVGINIPVPPYPLTIKASTLLDSTKGIGISQQDAAGLVRIGFYTTTGAGAFLQTHSNSDLNFTTNGAGVQMTLQKGTGYLGVATPAPLAPLHVAGTATEKLRLENTTTLNLGIRNDLYFKTGTYFTGGIKTIGTAANAARLGFFTYADPNSANLVERLSILDGGNVGIGKSDPTAKLEVNGTMKITDGTQGDKKVLTSDAAGNATWRNQAYGITERFQYRVDWNGANAFPLTKYNYGTTTITHSSASNKVTITFNKSGLYHLDFHIESSYTGNFSMTSANPRILDLYVGTVLQKELYIPAPYFYLLTPNASYSVAEIDREYERYFVAGEIFTFQASSDGPTVKYDCDILVTGHLISE